MNQRPKAIVLSVLAIACARTEAKNTDESSRPPEKATSATAPTRLRSPDGRFEARTATTPTGTHYRVADVASGKELFTTKAQFETVNVVDGGEFSGDSRNFGAFYPYSHADYATWAGIWDIQRAEQTEEMFFPRTTRTFNGVFHCAYSVRVEEGACVVSELSSTKTLFRTAQPDNPRNDVKACKLSPSCTRVAAFYHHDDRDKYASCAEPHWDGANWSASYSCDTPGMNGRCPCRRSTWVGVWSVPDGKVEYRRELDGYKDTDRTIFDRDPVE